MRHILLACLLASCVPAAPTEPLPTLDPPDESEGFQLTMGGVIVEPGEEVWWCSAYPIPVEETANVNWVRYLQNPGMHHMTLSTPGLTGEGVPYGEYDCNELYGDAAFMEGAVAIFGGTGTAEDEMHLPEGIVAALPATLDIIHEVHFVNPTDEPVELYSYLNAYTIPEDLVTDRIYGGSVRDENINVPAGAEGYEEWSRCAFDRDVEIHFLASHTHGLGEQFRIRSFDGTNVGEEVYRNDDLHTPGIVQFDPPIVVPEGQGFEWACRWDNPGGAVSYGLTATDEMCNMAVVFTPFDLTAGCRVVESSDGVLWE